MSIQNWSISCYTTPNTFEFTPAIALSHIEAKSINKASYVLNISLFTIVFELNYTYDI